MVAFEIENKIAYELARNCRKKVLIVEDEVTWQVVIKRALELIDSAIEVQFSNDANRALELLNSEETFDFVIADMNLNCAKSGLDLWDILHSQKIDIPFVLISATNREEFMSELFPHREEMIPRFIEKTSSVLQLSKDLESEYLLRFNKPSERLVNSLKSHCRNVDKKFRGAYENSSNTKKRKRTSH